VNVLLRTAAPATLKVVEAELGVPLLKIVPAIAGTPATVRENAVSSDSKTVRVTLKTFSFRFDLPVIEHIFYRAGSSYCQD